MLKRENASMDDTNGKRGRAVFASQAKHDFKALLESLVTSKLNAEELLDVFDNTGLVVPVVLVQNILVARHARSGDQSEQDAAERGERARAASKAPDESYFTKRQMIPAATETKYPSDVKRHNS